MSASVKLATSMPGDPQTNGVDALAPILVREGLGEIDEQLRVGIIWFDTSKVTTNSDTGDHVPTIRVRRIEPVGVVGDVDPSIVAAVEAAVERRTGRKAIPFGIVEVSSDGAFGDPDQRAIDDPEDEN
ncbi:hypothetical protein [Nocardioides kongjuensis]|uniref:Uncharacterized protein n=2 Tax=Nocardioides kongjuensis TaxID=349522 RepID=A0A852RSY4_9ACTN|nr:hypothetical protein [Nocardioides kongjuensis]NYD33869.1 hypothetical protein [Nocardioides kongjuensis]